MRNIYFVVLALVCGCVAKSKPYPYKEIGEDERSVLSKPYTSEVYLKRNGIYASGITRDFKKEVEKARKEIVEKYSLTGNDLKDFLRGYDENSRFVLNSVAERELNENKKASRWGYTAILLEWQITTVEILIMAMKNWDINDSKSCDRFISEFRHNLDLCEEQQIEASEKLAIAVSKRNIRSYRTSVAAAFVYRLLTQGEFEKVKYILNDRLQFDIRDESVLLDLNLAFSGAEIYQARRSRFLIAKKEYEKVAPEEELEQLKETTTQKFLEFKDVYSAKIKRNSEETETFYEKAGFPVPCRKTMLNDVLRLATKEMLFPLVTMENVYLCEQILNDRKTFPLKDKDVVELQITLSDLIVEETTRLEEARKLGLRRLVFGEAVIP